MLQLGEIVDNKYEIVSALGRGGFGAVFKARHLQLGRFVALKCLDRSVLQQPQGLSRFEREAMAINALRHKNIIGFYGYGVWDESPYMVMELAEGTPLNELLNERAISSTRAIRIISQVFEALSAAHQLGVVHRDLKPSNIIIGKNDDVKVIDFGLAKLEPGYGLPAQKLTETGLTVGSCHYMAPEQALGGTIDHRVDIYAAGCILYEMLCGKRPFEAEDEVSVMYMQLNNEPAPLPMNSPSITAFVRNCMTKDPNQRYSECQEALADLNTIARGGEITAAPSIVPGRKFHHLSKILVFCLASACVAGLFMVTAKQQTSVTLLRTAKGTGMLRFENSTAEQLEQIVRADEADHLLTENDRFMCYAFMGRAHAMRHEPFKDLLLKADALYPRVRKFTDAYWVLEYGKLLEDDKQYAKAATILSTELQQHTFGNPEVETEVAIRTAKNYCVINQPDKALSLMQLLIDKQKMHPEFSTQSRQRALEYLSTLKSKCHKPEQ